LVSDNIVSTKNQFILSRRGVHFLAVQKKTARK
jgi:hypothetical protein